MFITKPHFSITSCQSGVKFKNLINNKAIVNQIQD
jgi:hypothetical protein